MKNLVQIIHELISLGFEHFGRYYSSYRGFVVSNEDPENLGRLQLKVQNVYGDDIMGYWAWPKNQFSGSGYGSKITPQKGDMVWVEFELGSPRKPIYTLGHFGKGEIPDRLKSNNVFFFRSPKGQEVIIDDDNEIISFNQGTNFGLVKVKELTERLNTLETAYNTLLDDYKKHIHTDPLSGSTGVLAIPFEIQQDLVETKQKDIENTKIKH